MWTNQFYNMLILTIMSVLLRTSFELSKPFAQNSVTDSGFELTQKQKEWAQKAAVRYSETQSKKWVNWNEAMFESVK